MLCLSGFALYSRWVLLNTFMHATSQQQFKLYECSFTSSRRTIMHLVHFLKMNQLKS